ncbi:MAG: LysR family transcriptional regulator [Verrucomicrobia bacterium]|nr:LysR family transcriptional regulator [Verrucomicrobiota bacterium]MBI3871287.1 LysR family transcriptional regulator [Verrucomicrobiota bacterium]
MSGASSRSIAVHPRYRVLRGRDVALGPGKVELLRHIQTEGSIQKAAARMGMSYMRAWTLIRVMNKCFRHPLVSTRRGGARQGGAALTKTGTSVVDLYARIERESALATSACRGQLTRLLRS